MEKDLTIHQRKENIAKLVARFNTHILTQRRPESVLNNVECLGIAMCAREAVFCSSTCTKLPAGVCWRPGTNFYEWLQKTECEFPVSVDISDEKRSFLAKMVHAIIRHQHRLDENWYDKTLSEIESIFLADWNDDGLDGDMRKVRCHAAFCEILNMAAASHGIHMFYISIGENAPDLPTIEEARKVVECGENSSNEKFDFNSFFKKVQRNPGVSKWSPYFKKDDINENSPEFQSLSKPLQDFLIRNVGRGPRICIFFAFMDAQIVADINVTFYRDELLDKMAMVTMHGKCKGITRFQLETVATGYTGAVDCAF